MIHFCSINCVWIQPIISPLTLLGRTKPCYVQKSILFKASLLWSFESENQIFNWVIGSEITCIIFYLLVNVLPSIIANKSLVENVSVCVLYIILCNAVVLMNLCAGRGDTKIYYCKLFQPFFFSEHPLNQSFSQSQDTLYFYLMCFSTI